MIKKILIFIATIFALAGIAYASNKQMTTDLAEISDLRLTSPAGHIDIVSDNAGGFGFFTWPTNDGVAGTPLVTDGNGNLSFQAPVAARVWAGRFTTNSAAFWTVTSTTYADFDQTTASTLNEQYNQGFGTVSTISGGTTILPGVSITAIVDGTLRVEAIVSIDSSTGVTAKIAAGLQLIETNIATVLAYGSAGMTSSSTGGLAGNNSATIVLVGYFPVTNGSTYNFVVQGGSSAQTLAIKTGVTGFPSSGNAPGFLSFAMEYLL